MNPEPPDGDDGYRTLIRTSARPRGPTGLALGLVAVLVHHDEQGQVRRHRLAPGRPLVLGRRPPADLVLADAEVSGSHCRLVPGVDGVTVVDLGSTNGSFLDGQRLAGPALLQPGRVLTLGRQSLTLEWRDAADVDHAEALDRDLDRARQYVKSLLPPPGEAGPLSVAWHFQPSAALGGDGFGYFALDGQRWAGFLLDVAGHGVGPAMHSVTVMNLLRRRSLPEADLAQPAQVLAALNATFPMEEHDGLFFTIWYGVYDAAARRLRYASGGHHPAYLRRAGEPTPQPLRTRNLMIGASAGARFTDAECDIAAGDRLYLFSDGVFEAVDGEGRDLGLGDFLPLLSASAPGPDEPARLHAAAMARRRPGPPEDDCSLLVVTYS